MSNNRNTKCVLLLFIILTITSCQNQSISDCGIINPVVHLETEIASNSLFCETAVFEPINDENKIISTQKNLNINEGIDIFETMSYRQKGLLSEITSMDNTTVLSATPNGYFTSSMKSLDNRFSELSTAFGYGLFDNSSDTVFGKIFKNVSGIASFSFDTGILYWHIEGYPLNSMRFVAEKICIAKNTLAIDNDKIFVIDPQTGCTEYGIKFNYSKTKNSLYTDITYMDTSSKYVWFIAEYKLNTDDYINTNIFRYNPQSNEILMLSIDCKDGNDRNEYLKYDEFKLYGDRLFLISNIFEIITEVDQDTGIPIEEYDLDAMFSNPEVVNPFSGPIIVNIDNQNHIWHPSISNSPLSISSIYDDKYADHFFKSAYYYNSSYYYIRIENRLCGFNKETGEIDWWINTTELGEKPAIILDNEHGVLVKHGNSVSLFGVKE